MGKLWFTADWHIGEKAAPNTASYLRPRPTAVMVQEWLRDCHEKIAEQDTLYMLGDMIISDEYVSVLAQLPNCRKVLIRGDKEQKFNDVYLGGELMAAGCEFMADVLWKTIGGNTYCMLHKPEDALSREEKMSFLCGHVHGAWRTTRLPSGFPIINVGIDAWGGLVSEEMIIHQYNCVTKGYYDVNCFPQDWEKETATA